MPAPSFVLNGGNPTEDWVVPHREEWKSLCVLGRSCDILDSKSAVNLRAVVVVSAPKKRYTQDLFFEH